MAGSGEATTRGRILDAAVAALLDGGYENVSMDSVARQAGVSRRTLFNQFASKEALFAAALEDVWARIPILEITAAPDNVEDPAQGLAAITEAIAAFWAPVEAIALARMIVREGARFPSLADSYLMLGKAPRRATLVAYLDGQVRAGRLRIDDTDLAARQLTGLVTEPLVWPRVLGVEEASTPDRTRHVLREAVGMFMARYGVQPT